MKKFLFSVLFSLIVGFAYGQNLDSGCVGNWQFNGNANDISGNNNHGTVNGATLTTDRFGNPNSAYSFDGMSNYIVVPNSNSLMLTNSWTISTILKMSTYTSFQGQVVSKVQASGWYGGYEYTVRLDSSFCYQSNIGGVNISVGTAPYFCGIWYLFTVTFDGNTLKIYINDSLKKTISCPGSLQTSTIPLTFGRRSQVSSEYFNGVMDEIRIYNRVLTNAEIALLYNPIPVAPVLVTPTNNSVGLSVTPVLVWNVSVGAAGYKVKISSDSAFTTVTDSATVTTNQYSVPPGKLNYNTKYYWKVAGYNTYGTGQYSARWNFTTLNPLPLQVTLLSPANGSNNVAPSPTLLWNESLGATGYKVKISSDSTFTTVTDSATVTANQYSVPSGKLNYNTKYYWKVAGYNTYGTGQYSARWNFTTLNPLPLQVTLLSPSNGSNNVALSPTLLWNESLGATGYKVKISNDSAFTIVTDSATVTTNQYSVPSGKLNYNTKYYWKVAGYNTYGTGQYSTRWNFTTLNPLPLQVTLVSPANGSNNVTLSPTLIWNTSTNSTSYTVQVSPNSGFTYIVDSITVTTNQRTIPPGKLNAATTYYWRVQGVNSYGSGPWSTVWNFFTVVTGVQIIGTEIPSEYKLYDNYPNPFNPTSTIKYDIPEKSFVKIKVYDVTGKTISTLINEELAAGRYEVQFESGNLASGIYFCKIEANNFKKIIKMMLIK